MSSPSSISSATGNNNDDIPAQWVVTWIKWKHEKHHKNAATLESLVGSIQPGLCLRISDIFAFPVHNISTSI